MKNRKYEQFVNRWKDVTDLPEQNIGLFTPLYHRIVAWLKVMPAPFLAAGGMLVAVFLFLIFGSAIVRLVSVLQRGF
jgi:hypothetical protein